MRVGIVAPSSGVLDPSRLKRGARVLEELGLQVVFAPGVFDVRGYLAGSDKRRAEDLLWALEAEELDAVWCSRGGYGAQRTVAALDLSRLVALAGRSPKVFVGFSDATVIHALLRAELGWHTFYGPMLSSLGRATTYTLAALRRALFEIDAFTIGPDPDDPWVETLTGGQAEGPIAGGCLQLLASLVGTPLAPSFAGRVAFFEDVGVEPYVVDRNLSQLLAAGCFDGCLGVLAGEHHRCVANGGSSLGLEQVFADLLGPLAIPAAHGLPLGHGQHLATIPLSVQCRFDADAGTLDILEPGVE